MQPLPDITKRLPVTSGTTMIRIPSLMLGSDPWSSLLLPASVEFDLSVLDERHERTVLLFWHNDPLTPAYDLSLVDERPQGVPGAYRIEGRTGAGAWSGLVEVPDNRYSSGQHLLACSGCDRLRITFLTALDGSGVTARVAIHDASGGLEDAWAFYGDSITEAALDHADRGVGTWPELISEALPGHTPVQQCCGTGGLTTVQGAESIDRWLAVFPGRHAPLAFGTNDINRADPQDTGVADVVAASYEHMIDAVVAAGKVPVVPTIPWGSTPGVTAHGATANGQIDRVCAARPEVVRGPDLWELFATRPDLMAPDGFHPTEAGYAELRTAWATTMVERVYRS